VEWRLDQAPEAESRGSRSVNAEYNTDHGLMPRGNIDVLAEVGLA